MSVRVTVSRTNLIPTTLPPLKPPNNETQFFPELVPNENAQPAQVLPWPGNPGFLFGDLNGNGVPDPGEPVFQLPNANPKPTPKPTPSK